MGEGRMGERVESMLAEMQRRTIERTRLEGWSADLERIDAGLVDMLDDDERDVACGHIRKAVASIRQRIGRRGVAPLVERIRLNRCSPVAHEDSDRG